MINSVIYGACFLILFFHNDKQAKILAVSCIGYIVTENMVYVFFHRNIDLFDLTLYLNICWALDSILLFVVGCCLRGVRQILVVSLSVPLFLLQVFVVQYPTMFPPWAYVFVIEDAHTYFLEMFVFIHVWQDNTIKEWIKTGTVLFLVAAAHLLKLNSV